MKMWLYRVMESDDDGDPLDWGAVHAATYEQAQDHVAKRMADIECCGWDGGIVTVRFYECMRAAPSWGESDGGVVAIGETTEACLEIPEP